VLAEAPSSGAINIDRSKCRATIKMTETHPDCRATAASAPNAEIDLGDIRSKNRSSFQRSIIAGQAQYPLSK
jgi:hypothetical protein